MAGFWWDRLRNGAIYVTVSVAIACAVGYLILRRTSVDKTYVNEGGQVNNWWKDGRITVLPAGCAIIKADKLPVVPRPK